MNSKLNIRMVQMHDIEYYNMSLKKIKNKPILTRDIKILTLKKQLKDALKELKQVTKERDELKKEVFFII